MKKAIVLIAHGSKKQSSNDEFLNMVENMKDKHNYAIMEAAFLELANPDIVSCVENLILNDIKKIDFYPFFLNSGKHVLIDIPNIIQELQKKYPQIDLTLLNHFGKSKKIEEIILNDIQ